MTKITQTDTDNAHSTYKSVIDPATLADNEEFDIRQRTYSNGNQDHCEADAAGRAIVGVTDEEKRLLLLINPATDHAVLLNDTVAPDEDWAIIAQHRVKEMAGIDVTLDAVLRVRRVDHVIDGESTPRSTTYHVVFSASVASPGATLDGLCDDNAWEIGWYTDLPVEVDNDESGVLDDIELFLG